jgi:hypothetical protein
MNAEDRAVSPAELLETAPFLAENPKTAAIFAALSKETFDILFQKGAVEIDDVIALNDKAAWTVVPLMRKLDPTTEARERRIETIIRILRRCERVNNASPEGLGFGFPVRPHGGLRDV